MRRWLLILLVLGFDPPAAQLNTWSPSKPAADPVRVCADPGNLPFSNQQHQGFENRLARMLADALGAPLEFTWWPQRLGFIRHTLESGRCDVIMGYPSNADNVLTTVPYYRSTYVFVTRRDLGMQLSGLDDERLRRLRIGVQLIGDDGANAPPAHALSRRGIIANLVGFPVYADAGRQTSAIIDAVAEGRIDVAAAWGPTAGYFAGRQQVPLDVSPISPRVDGALPETFDISMAVRRGDIRRRERLDQFIRRHRVGIAKLLNEYRVPQLALDGRR